MKMISKLAIFGLLLAGNGYANSLEYEIKDELKQIRILIDRHGNELDDYRLINLRRMVLDVKQTLKDDIRAVEEAREAVRINEAICYNAVQGIIAWDYNGSRNWSRTNLENLCRGTLSGREPGQCFDQVMHGGVNWGGGTRWKWENALNLCAGTNSAYQRVSCFERKVNRNIPWSQAISDCKAVTIRR